MSHPCMNRLRSGAASSNDVELFFDGPIDKMEAINRLRYEKPNLQICFRTEKALSLLHFEGSETL